MCELAHVHCRVTAANLTRRAARRGQTVRSFRFNSAVHCSVCSRSASSAEVRWKRLGFRLGRFRTSGAACQDRSRPVRLTSECSTLLGHCPAALQHVSCPHHVCTPPCSCGRHSLQPRRNAYRGPQSAARSPRTACNAVRSSRGVRFHVTMCSPPRLYSVK
jgi:hypothetical protein